MSTSSETAPESSPTSGAGPGPDRLPKGIAPRTRRIGPNSLSHNVTEGPFGRLSRRQMLGAMTATAAAGPLLGCAPSAVAPRAATDLLYIGTWGRAQLSVAEFDSVTGDLRSTGVTAAVDSSWSVPHPSLPVLYVAGGGTGGVVGSYRIDPATGGLTRTSQVSTGGTGTAGVVSYIAVDEPSRTLLIANFAGGLVATVPIDGDGLLGSPVSVVRESGSGPNARQQGPHPHHIVLDPTGQWALVADFGADRIFVHGFDRATRVLSAASNSCATAPGSGPRRLAFHPGGRVVYLINELTADIQTLAWDSASHALTPRESLSIGTPSFTGGKSAAEMMSSSDARYLYVANRAENTLLVYAVDPATAALREVQRIPCAGTKPWSFSIHRTGRWMFVVNQGDDNVAVFGIDPKSGRLTDTGKSISVPAPDGIAFYNR